MCCSSRQYSSSACTPAGTQRTSTASYPLCSTCLHGTKPDESRAVWGAAGESRTWAASIWCGGPAMLPVLPPFWALVPVCGAEGAWSAARASTCVPCVCPHAPGRVREGAGMRQRLYAVQEPRHVMSWLRGCCLRAGHAAAFIKCGVVLALGAVRSYT